MFRKQQSEKTSSTAPLLEKDNKQDASHEIKTENSSRDLQLLELIKSSNVRKARHLLEFGVNVNFQDPKTGKTALMMIAENKTLSSDDKEKMTKLLFKGSSKELPINTNLLDKEGKTALDYFIADALVQNNMHDGIILVANVTKGGAAQYQELVTTFMLARESERILSEKQQHEEEPPKSKWFCC